MVSVVIPCYNNEDTLSACVDSVLKQTFSNVEIIISDDGSMDGSLKIAQDLSQRAPEGKIRVFSQTNAGPSVARNRGIQESRGQYLAFLDADDEWIQSEKLERQMKVFADHADAILVGCIHYSDRPYNTSSIVLAMPFRLMLSKNRFPTSGVVVKKQALPDALFPEDQRYSEDYALWLNLGAANSGKFYLINEAMCRNILNKPAYGVSGLAGRLWLMEKGELRNYKILRQNRQLSLPLYMKVSGYSFLKFLYRYIVTRLRP